MELCLIELNEQILILKKAYYRLQGASLYTTTFSNHTIMTDNKAHNEIGAKSLNNKIKYLNEYLISLQEYIDNL